MMKFSFIACLAVLIAGSVYSQEPDKALIRVRYSFSHIQDTTNRAKAYTENMLLIAGRNASVYTSYDKVNQMLATRKQIEEQIKNNAGGPQHIRIDKTGSRPVTQTDHYFFAKERKLVTKENLFNNYLVEEVAPEIDWKITNDTMSFSGIHCQKATASFKGRNWTAWFATDMPFQSGPWKLNGLPGLIIEAYDSEKEVQFLFAGTEKVEAEISPSPEGPATPGGLTVKLPGMDVFGYTGSEIKLPADAIKTTRKELDKLKEARDKDPQGFMRAQMAASGMNGNIQMRGPGPGGPAGPPKPVINNPVELPERK